MPHLHLRLAVSVLPGRHEQGALRIAAGQHCVHVAVALPIARPVDDDAVLRPHAVAAAASSALSASATSA